MHQYLSVSCVSSVLLTLFQVVAAISDETQQGLIIGCAVGGVVLLVVLVLCCCVLHRKKASDKAKQLPKLGLNGNTPTPSSQVSVPPGVWTSSPTMVAVPPPQMGYNPPPQRGPSLPQENIKRPKRLPRDGKVPSEMRQAPQPKPRWQRTFSRAHKALKQIPAVFQVKVNNKQTLAFKREHENTQAKIPDKQSKRDSVESNSKQEVRRSKSEQEDQRHSGSMQREVHDLSGGMPSHQKQPPKQPHISLQNSLTSTLPARIEETDEDDSSPGAPAGPFVAKAYSNYKRNQPNPGDPNVARVFSSYTTLDSHRDPYQARANIQSSKKNPQNITQSDAFLHRKGRPVSRTHSDLSNAKAGVPPPQFLQRPPGPVGGSWNPYGQGVLIRSQGWHPPQGGSRKTHSLDRKPKAVFAPSASKQETKFVWKEQPGHGQKKPPPKIPPKKATKPEVTDREKSSIQRDPPKIILGHSGKEGSRPVVKPPAPLPDDKHHKISSKTKDKRSSEDIGHRNSVPVVQKHGTDHITGEKPEQQVVVIEGAESREQIKSSSSATDEGKEITADAFKFLEDFEDYLSHGDTND